MAKSGEIFTAVRTSKASSSGAGVRKIEVHRATKGFVVKEYTDVASEPQTRTFTKSEDLISHLDSTLKE